MAKYDGSVIGVGELLVYMKATLLLLWLKVFLFLPEWPQVGHSQTLGPPEVVIPVRVTPPGEGMNLQGWHHYQMHFGGQRHVIHIKVKNNFLFKNFPLYTYIAYGNPQRDHHFVQENCYYRGYVEGDPESLVSLSDCFRGFQGMLQTNGTVYEIQPKTFSTTFEHLIYKLDSAGTNLSQFRCGLSDENTTKKLKFQESINSTLMQSGYRGWWTHSYSLELAVVVDHTRYLHHERNISLVLKEVFLVLNGVSNLLKALDLEVVLAGMEIWTTKSFITKNTINLALENFCSWKKKGFHYRVRHNLAHLFLNMEYGETVGLAHVGSVCTSLGNCGVETFHNESIFVSSYVVTHAIGHNLGMNHDVNTCKCGASRCILFPYVALTTEFSNCSYAGYWNLGSRRQCLKTVENPFRVIKETRCGNGVVEEGEQCDCGPLKMCDTDPCCQLNCTVTAGVSCAFGPCCQNCKFRLSGTMCREVENECDLPEWCNGTSYQCPEDVYLQDWTSCTGAGYCYRKRCIERNEQCRKIFGKEAKSANVSCYEAVNTQGDRFGNCGLTATSYVKCSMLDSLCGRIQCENVKEIPQMSNHTTLHCTKSNNNTCWGTDYHHGMTMADIGDVKDGTKCGPENVCLRRKCVSLPFTAHLCTPHLCYMRGVCNNKRHCHCNPEWGPPMCHRKGRGGSVDSGPPPEPQMGERGGKSNPLLYLLIPFLFVLLCLLLLLSMRSKKQDAKAEAPVPQDAKAEAPVPQDAKAKAPVPQDAKAKAPVPQDAKAKAPVPQDAKAKAPVPPKTT